MCTVSWIRTPEGFELFHNRDESVARRPGSPPEVRTLEGVRVLAPRDGDFGGTWIGVSELGLALCVLNHYGAGPPPDAPVLRSRGLLVLDLAAARSPDEVGERLAATDLAPYAGFVLVALGAREPARAYRWDGAELAPIESEPPLVSSSIDATGAEQSRRAVYRRLASERGAVDRALLAAYHRGHEPEAGPLSVCMHRGDALTVSSAHVRVGARSVSLAHAPGPPCATPFGPPLALPRRGAGARS